MNNEIKTLLAQEQWKRWHHARNLHLLVEEEELTKPGRQKTGKTPRQTSNSVSADRRPIKPEDLPNGGEEETRSNVFVDGNGLSDLGKIAIKANSIWTNNLTQMINFQMGKQLSQQLGRKLAKQIGMDAVTGEKVAEAVMKQVLEHLDEMSTQDMEKAFPGIFDRTRG